MTHRTSFNCSNFVQPRNKVTDSKSNKYTPISLTTEPLHVLQGFESFLYWGDKIQEKKVPEEHLI